ncbi:MAG: hypothetical protein R3C10_04025 [Pirellulales bacterium]
MARTFFFDACIGKPLVDNLRARLVAQAGDDEDPIELRHLSEEFDLDVDDDVWVPEVAERGWVIISSDLGRRQPRLPAICSSYDVTHVLLSGGMHNLRSQDKEDRLFALWASLQTVFDEPAGTRFQIDKSGDGARLKRK